MAKESFLTQAKHVELWIILRDIVVLLAAALLCGGLVARWGHSPLIGYLAAGMVLGGPGSLGLVRSQHEIEAIAELGVALLLFSLGLEFSVQRMWQLGQRPLAGGILQVVLTLAVGALIVWPLGVSLPAAIAFGAMISLSSTAVVLRMLLERSELETPHGRNCLAVLLTQDMAVVPLALLLSILGGEGGAAGTAKQMATLLGYSLVLVLGLWIVTRIAVVSLGTLTLQRNRELTVVFASVMGLGAAWAAHAAGVSPALGTFVAGMLLGSSAFATQVRADISSLRVLLLTLFFGAAGMMANPFWILDNWLSVALTTLALTVGKMLIVWGIFRWLEQSVRVSAATACCLAQMGEFAFVLGTIGKSNGVVSPELYALVVSTTIASFVLSAYMVPAATRFGDLMAGLFSQESAPADEHIDRAPTPQVVIIGFGPAGQAVGDSLKERDLGVAIIDLNHDGVRRAIELGFTGYIGDATQWEVLEHAQIAQAQAIVITVPHHKSALAILDSVRHLAPQAFVLARSRYKMHSHDFAARGVQVIGDEEEVGSKLAAQLAAALAIRWRTTTQQKIPNGGEHGM